MKAITSTERGNALLVGILILAVVIAGAIYVYTTALTPDPTEPAAVAEPAAEEADDMTTTVTSEADSEAALETTTRPVTVTPIAHATMVLDWTGTVMYVDPVGGAEAFAGQPAPDVILLTDSDRDHLSVDTLSAIATEATVIIAPQAVIDELPADLITQTRLMNNGDEETIGVFTLTAVPMYNLPEQGVELRHVKGRGNGYVIDDGSYRVYIAGDTADVPELRSQTDIDLAFVPMNPPYTMSIERAADGVLAFQPAVVIPYHYRTPEGFSDVRAFRSLVMSADPDIEVELLDWYPDTEEDLTPEAI